MTSIILAINFIGAVASIIGWIKRPSARIYAIVVFGCNIISAVTAKFTNFSLVFLIIALIIIILIFSVHTFAEYEKHIVTAQVHYPEATKQQMMSIAKTCRKGSIFSLTRMAEVMEFAANKGVEFNHLKPILQSGTTLATAISCPLKRALNLLIVMSRIFDITDYERLSDKICVAYERGVPAAELENAVLEYSDRCVKPDAISIHEFLGTIITLARKEIRGKVAGESIAGIINGLIGLS